MAVSVPLKINIQPVYQNAPFLINRQYSINGHATMFTRFSFFISSIRLTTNTKDSLLKDIVLLDMTNLQDSVSSSGGLSVAIGNAPVGAYTGISFGIGVDSILNAQTPDKFTSDQPLSDASYYWNDWTSYIFSKLEGKIDLDGSGQLRTGITLHTGGNSIYKIITIQHPFQISSSNNQTIKLSIDFAQVISGIDFTTTNATHGRGDISTMEKLIGNMGASIQLKN